MRWPGPTLRLFDELAAWRHAVAESVTIDERRDATPHPYAQLVGSVHGGTCVIGDAGGRYLVRAEGTDVVAAVQPESGVLAALLQRFDRAPMQEVRAFAGDRAREAWLEVGDLPILWGLGHPLSTRLRMRRADWREERRRL